MNLLEEMSEILQPYAGVIAKTATLLKISQMLSPLVIFNNMRKAKSTMGMPFFPMLLGLVLYEIAKISIENYFSLQNFFFSIFHHI
jgi:hypothetical protein